MSDNEKEVAFAAYLKSLNDGRSTLTFAEEEAIVAAIEAVRRVQDQGE